MEKSVIAGLGVLLVLILVILRWKMKSWACQVNKPQSMQPQNNVVSSFELEEKDSLDEHLESLTTKLAEKEGRLRLSKSKIRETQHEIDSLHDIDMDVQTRYVEVMKGLRTDLMGNEKDCKKLQDQIERMSRRRAELKDEVYLGQKLYGVAAADLASNLSELQKGRVDYKVTDKPLSDTSSLRLRKGSELPRSPIAGSIVLKTPPIVSPQRTRSSSINK